eukprot:CAMPEP_0178391032 /NCGR_PEP_ID=MMETSP0689_2-20121128/10953_1 /TAXON_ID=160604 /ORGANISM="Amphidinium massartii, Strain CS-259" /LENGTH=384 /DNA_ID=CAMNT_0020011561 /DNA_START=1 /DNA_END=1155 /DNA_ORIENTATION=+
MIAVNAFVPEMLRDDLEFMRRMVARDPLQLGAASDRLRDNVDLVATAAVRDGEAFQFASDRLKSDFASVMGMVQANGEAFPHASDVLRSDEQIVRAALWSADTLVEDGQGNWVHRSTAAARLRIMMSIPDTAAALRRNMLLEHRDRLFLGPHEAIVAVRRSGMALQFVPVDFMTRDIIMTAVEQNGLALQYARPWLERDIDPLQNVPADLITLEVIMAAVLQNGMALQYVPTAEWIDDEILLNIIQMAVQQNGHALQFVPADLITLEMIIAAVGQNGMALQYVPAAEWIDDEILLNIIQMAVQQNGHALQFVPPELQSRHLVKQALLQSNAAVMHVADDQLRRELHGQLVWHPWSMTPDDSSSSRDEDQLSQEPEDDDAQEHMT